VGRFSSLDLDLESAHTEVLTCYLYSLILPTGGTVLPGREWEQLPADAWPDCEFLQEHGGESDISFFSLFIIIIADYMRSAYMRWSDF
jgi:hypothetical protein